MSMKKRFFATLTLSLLAAAFTGCGSGNKEASTGPLTNVGDSACIQCHSSVTEALTGESIVAQYQRSSPHNTDELGCESCHGSGAMHNGVGPIPYPQPDANRCATCHDGVTAPATNANTAFTESSHAIQSIRTGATCKRCHSHEGAVLSNIAGFTGDYAVMEDAVNQASVPLVTDYTQINCATCHEHGGGLRPIKATVMGTDLAGNVTRTKVNWDPNNNGKTDQFDLCTSCHNMYSYNGSQLLVDGGTYSTVVTGRAGHHDTSWYRLIATTHYDNPFTGVGLATNVIEGYNLRKTGTNPCFDCHAHEAETNTRYGSDPAVSTLYTDWAQSAHAGGLLAKKYANASSVATVMAVGVEDDTDGAAWAHYDWDKTKKLSSGVVVKDREDCQRCHTSTGASNFMTNPATYNAENNDFSHLSGWKKATDSAATVSSGQNELLYCWGCHTNAGKGILRTPGAITETYGAATTGDPATTVSYPDVSGSNVCMTCHLGRETGEVIKNANDIAKEGAAVGERSFINSHYLTAGGQLFGTTGYEYGGVNYTNPSYFKHDKVGSASAPGTGTNGPCAGCHMQTPNSHSFLPVTKDTTGAITAITSTACATCHSGGFALTPEGLTSEEEEYQAALEALKQTLNDKDIYFYEAHPYFYTAPYVVGGTNTGVTNWGGVYDPADWKDVMGAAFNYNLLFHDPGGYAHNRIYSKRLIWDSIDFIYNSTIDNDVIAAIEDQVTAGRLDRETADAAEAYLGATRP